MPRFHFHPCGAVSSVSCSAREVAEWHGGYGFNSSGAWPCGTLSGSFVASFDPRGNLIDLAGPRGRSIDPAAHELCAIVADACLYRGCLVPASCAPPLH